MTIYQITLRDRETRTVLGYYNGAWTTDRHRAIALPSARWRKTTPPGCAISARGMRSLSTSRRSLPPTST